MHVPSLFSLQPEFKMGQEKEKLVFRQNENLWQRKKKKRSQGTDKGRKGGYVHMERMKAQEKRKHKFEHGPFHG